MIRSIYCIRDLKVGYLTPMVDVNDQTAIRNFGVATQHQESMMFAHPEDFELYKIGEFDDENAVIITMDKVYLASALDFRKE